MHAEGFAAADGNVVDVAQHQTAALILRSQRAIRTPVIDILVRRRGSQESDSLRGVLKQLPASERHEQRKSLGEPLFHARLEGMVNRRSECRPEIVDVQELRIGAVQLGTSDGRLGERTGRYVT